MKNASQLLCRDREGDHENFREPRDFLVTGKPRVINYPRQEARDRCEPVYLSSSLSNESSSTICHLDTVTVFRSVSKIVLYCTRFSGFVRDPIVNIRVNLQLYKGMRRNMGDK